jgi:hypothetical protein
MNDDNFVVMKRVDDGGSTATALPVMSVAAPRTLPSQAPVPRVIVGVYRTVLEAELARGRLEADGVDARLNDAHTVGMAQHMSMVVGGVKLHVPEPDVEHARAVLSETGLAWPAQHEEDSDDDDGGGVPVRAQPLVVALTIAVGVLAMLAVAWPR